MSRKSKKKRTAGDMIGNIVMAAAIGVFLFSAAKLSGIFLEYKKGTEEYDKVREYVTVSDDKKEEEQTPKPDAKAESRPIPPAVDWERLKSINADIVAWLQIEGTEISYPVVQGTDNDYYLKHTFERTPNSAGAIFIECTNSRNFEDCNTIIYGHNMKNGSMFGLLRRYFESSDSLPGKYIWLCTPEKSYRYEIFSSHIVDAGGDVYTLFSAPDDQFAAYVENMKQRSLVDFGVTVGKEDKVITLSTCTGNEATRFVVQAKRESEY